MRGVRMSRKSVAALLLLAAGVAAAAVRSGNEYALSLVEPKAPAVRQSNAEEGRGKQFFFRYLEVLEIEKGQADGYPQMTLKTREPSSGVTVRFVVRKSVSLSVLQQTPVTSVGDAVAVTGVISAADPATREIVLNPVIVRHKDRLAPKVGKEMLAEVDSSAVVYSFTGGGVAVNVSKRDEDLIANEKEMIAKLGKEGWARHLLAEIAKRDKAERAKRDQLDIYRKPQGK